jgi:hypothetical protein
MIDRLQWLYIPAFAAGAGLHLAKPIHLVPSLWIGAVVASCIAVVAAVVGVPAIGRRAPLRIGIALLLLYVAASFLLNSIWPPALLLPLFAFMVRWRAIEKQTGRS